jgi:hypothetical protein
MKAFDEESLDRDLGNALINALSIAAGMREGAHRTISDWRRNLNTENQLAELAGLRAQIKMQAKQHRSDVEMIQLESLRKTSGLAAIVDATKSTAQQSTLRNVGHIILSRTKGGMHSSFHAWQLNWNISIELKHAKERALAANESHDVATRSMMVLKMEKRQIDVEVATLKTALAAAGKADSEQVVHLRSTIEELKEQLAGAYEDMIAKDDVLQNQNTSNAGGLSDEKERKLEEKNASLKAEIKLLKVQLLKAAAMEQQMASLEEKNASLKTEIKLLKDDLREANEDRQNLMPR